MLGQAMFNESVIPQQQNPADHRFQTPNQHFYGEFPDRVDESTPQRLAMVTPKMYSSPSTADMTRADTPSAITPQDGCLNAQDFGGVAACVGFPGIPGCESLLPRANQPLCNPQDYTPQDCASLLAAVPLATGQEMIRYCDEYGTAGPDGTKNTFCYTLFKLPDYEAQARACYGVEKGMSTRTMALGGLLLLLLGGGAYYYYKR